MAYNINDIIAITGAEASVPNPGAVVELAIDSRKINLPQETLFFALKGDRQNGHHYIKDAYEKGVRYFIVSQPIEDWLYPNAHFIMVKDSLEALQTITSFHRHQFTFPVIGLTGSNGKTIIKEWLFQLLNDDYHIVRSPKSYNSQVGVPLAVWQMQQEHQLAIFEAGISQPAEMKKLQAIIDPEMGVFTFLGDAHAEGFASKNQKVNEKLQLFTGSKCLFFCADEKELMEAIHSFKAATNTGLALFSWGKQAYNFLQLQSTCVEQGGTSITCIVENAEQQFFIPFTDEASLHNSITCITILFYLKITAAQIRQRLLLLRPVEMRLELKQGINNCSIINDGYSADMNSLGIALNFLEQQQQHARRTVILSDLFESGQQHEALYRNIASILKQKKLFRFVGIGSAICKHAAMFTGMGTTHFYQSTQHFLQDIPSLHFFEETILLKGARVFQFEAISKRLEQKMHQTFLEIDLNALRHNINVYRQQLRPGVKLMCMVKAFSYGSGSFEIASLLQHAGVDYLGVAYADEGVELRKASIKLPVMVMNTEEAGFDSILQYKLEPELYSFKILQSFKEYLLQQNIVDYPVHIKVDTGMNRLGFEPEEIEALAFDLHSSATFKVVSVFSHLAGGGEALHDAFTQEQGRLLSQAATTLQKILGYSFMTHIANSGAINRHPHLQLNMVRLGIGMFGVDSDASIQARLRNVTTLKTSISQIKHVKKGESIGYSRSAVADEDKVIATVRIGYADGYPRLLSNGVGAMLVNGKEARVMGRVCMDMTMLDITGIAAAEEDEVIVFGEGLPVHKLAGWAQTIDYEILTNISGRVRRVYFED